MKQSHNKGMQSDASKAGAADAERYVAISNRSIYEPTWACTDGRVFKLSKKFL